MRRLSPYDGTKLFQMKTIECYQSHLTERNKRTFWPTQYNTAVIKTAAALARSRNTQRRDTEQRREKPAPLGSVTLDEGREEKQCRKAASSRNGTRKTDGCVQRKKWEPSLTTYTKIDSKWTQDLNGSGRSHCGAQYGSS